MKPRPTVFVETTVLSYLVSRKAREQIYAARQTLTRAWWKQRHEFALFTSTTVRAECELGDPREVTKRLAVAGTMGLLQLTAEAEDLGEALVKLGALPEKAQTDALHLAVAAVGRMEFVASWNYRHLINRHIQQQVFRIMQHRGYNMPEVRTPEGLLEVIR